MVDEFEEGKSPWWCTRSRAWRSFWLPALSGTRQSRVLWLPDRTIKMSCLHSRSAASASCCLFSLGMTGWLPDRLLLGRWRGNQKRSSICWCERSQVHSRPLGDHWGRVEMHFRKGTSGTGEYRDSRTWRFQQELEKSTLLIWHQAICAYYGEPVTGCSG